MWGMTSFHIVIIAVSNYLVQWPVMFFGWHTTWGALTFPLCYIASDFTIRLFGAGAARKVLGLIMAPALFLSYILSVVVVDGQWQGISSLAHVNTFVARIAAASFMAFVVGQLLDIICFSKLRERVATWWVAPVFASIVGNAVDSYLFFAGAFYQSSDAFMASHWPEIACVDYVFKILISVLLFVPTYGLLVDFCRRRFTQVYA